LNYIFVYIVAANSTATMYNRFLLT